MKRPIPKAIDKKPITISLYWEANLHEAIKAKAAETNRSLSGYLRHLAKQALEQPEAK